MRKITTMIALMLVFILSFGACTPPEDGAGTPTVEGSSTAANPETTGEKKVGGTLNVGLTGSPYSLASWVSNDMNSSLITNIAFPRLMEIDENGNKVPYIIDTYEMNEDGSAFTIKLHEGLNWHDGKPFTVDDVMFTAEYVVAKGLGFGADMYSPVDTMDKISDLEMTFNLKGPTVNFLSQVGYWVQIMPKHIYETVEDPMTFDHPVIGYGPYKYVESVAGEYYSFKRVENWPLANEGKGAYIENIIYRIFPDPNALILALKNGEIDAAASPIPTVGQKQIASEGERFEMLGTPSLGFGYFGLSYKNEVLADKNVRKAIAMSIDRDALIKIAMQDGAIPMNTPISPVYEKSVASDIKFPAFDLDAATATLEAAGYLDADGDGVREDKKGAPISFRLTYRNTTVNADSIANIFKDNLGKIGIGIEMQPLEPATYTDRVTKGHDFDIMFIDWGVIDDPDSSLSTIYHSNSALNFMEFSNPEMDAILDAVESETDYEKRIKMMDEFQELFIEELPTVNTWVRINTFAVSTAFDGWSLHPGLHGILNTREIVQVSKK